MRMSIFHASIISIIVLLIDKGLSTSQIDCFGLKCPSGSIMCLYKEKSVETNASVIGKASCVSIRRRVLLSGWTQSPNPKGEVVLNQYRYYGPGVYNKERVNYSRKRFFKRLRITKLSVERQLEDMRQRMNEELADKLTSHVFRNF